MRMGRDCMGPREFIAKFGRRAYRAVPRDKVRKDGKRIGIVHSYCAELVAA